MWILSTQRGNRPFAVLIILDLGCVESFVEMESNLTWNTLMRTRKTNSASARKRRWNVNGGLLFVALNGWLDMIMI